MDAAHFGSRHAVYPGLPGADRAIRTRRRGEEGRGESTRHVAPVRRYEGSSKTSRAQPQRNRGLGELRFSAYVCACVWVMTCCVSLSKFCFPFLWYLSIYLYTHIQRHAVLCHVAVAGGLLFVHVCVRVSLRTLLRRMRRSKERKKQSLVGKKSEGEV